MTTYNNAPLPYLVDRRDPTRVYMFDPVLARNPWLVPTNEPPPTFSPEAHTRAVQRAMRMTLDPKLSQIREITGALLGANSQSVDQRTREMLREQQERQRQLAAVDPTYGVLPPTTVGVSHDMGTVEEALARAAVAAPPPAGMSMASRPPIAAALTGLVPVAVPHNGA